jgi:hypothetical protein
MSGPFRHETPSPKTRAFDQSQTEDLITMESDALEVSLTRFRLGGAVGLCRLIHVPSKKIAGQVTGHFDPDEPVRVSVPNGSEIKSACLQHAFFAPITTDLDQP